MDALSSFSREAPGPEEALSLNGEPRLISKISRYRTRDAERVATRLMVACVHRADYVSHCSVTSSLEVVAQTRQRRISDRLFRQLRQTCRQLVLAERLREARHARRHAFAFRVSRND